MKQLAREGQSYFSSCSAVSEGGDKAVVELATEVK